MAFPFSMKVVVHTTPQTQEVFIRLYTERHSQEKSGIKPIYYNPFSHWNKVTITQQENGEVIIEHWFHVLFFFATLFSLLVFCLEAQLVFKILQLGGTWIFYYLGNCYLEIIRIKFTVKRIENQMAREEEAELTYHSPYIAENGLCPACGFQNLVDAEFCNDCGIKFID